MCLSSTAKHHGSLKRRLPLLWSVWTGPICWSLSGEEQQVFPVVQLGLEELVLFVRQFDAQQVAASCRGHVLLHPDLPASCTTALSWPRAVQ